MGPGYVLDDWFALANARLDGWWTAAGDDQWLARPGAGVVYAFVFGVLGERPMAAFAVSLAMVAACAVLLRRLLGELGVRSGAATAVAAVWVVLPNHGSLLFWPSASNITMSLVLLLAGLLALARLRVGTRPSAAQVLLLPASVLCYEATVPAALVGLFVVPRLVTGAWQWRQALPGAVALGLAGAWMIVFFHPAKQVVDRWADLGPVLNAHAGWGVVSPRWLANATALAFAVGLTLVVVRARGLARGLAVAGLAVIVLGTLPFVRYFYSPLGAGDRVNVVASVGTALAWTGLGLAVWERARAIAAVASAALLAGASVATWEASVAWSSAADDAREWLAAATSTRRPADLPPVRRNVAAYLDPSNWVSAIELRRGARVRPDEEILQPPLPAPAP